MDRFTFTAFYLPGPAFQGPTFHAGPRMRFDQVLKRHEDALQEAVAMIARDGADSELRQHLCEVTGQIAVETLALLHKHMNQLEARAAAHTSAARLS